MRPRRAIHSHVRIRARIRTEIRIQRLAGSPMQRSAPTTRRPGTSGFTLLEVLIATGIMALLGAGLVALLTRGVAIWNRAENTGRVYEQARAVLDVIAADLRSTQIRAHAGDDDVDIRFLCDRDPGGRQRLRFVRTTSAETSDPVLRQGGKKLAIRTPAVYDGRDDLREANEGLLAAPGGTMEVMYALDPRPGERLLWRGVKAPIGGAGSLFREERVGETPEASRPARRGLVATTKAEGQKSDEESRGPDVPFADVARPVTDGVLFLGFAFWGPTTSTWDPSARPLLSPESGAASGPLFHWDSTRALLDIGGAAGELLFRKRQGSLDDPTDDIFPEMVEVTLVLSEDDSPLGARLSQNINAAASHFLISKELTLPDDPRNRFLLVGDEWIALKSIDGRAVVVATGGRGVRDTKPADHAAGTHVKLGITFRRVVEIPGNRRARPAVGEGRRRSRTLLRGYGGGR